MTLGLRRSLLFLVGFTLHTVSYSVGTTFLSIPTTPREMAGGGFFTSLKDQTLFHGNPAAIYNHHPSMIAFITYNSWLSDSKGIVAGIIHPTLGGVGAITLRQLALSDLEYRTEVPTDNPLSHFSASGTTVEMTYAKELNKLVFGSTIRWISIDTYTYLSTGGSVDLGLQYALANGKYSFGASLLNLGAMSRFREVQPQLPTTISGGLTFSTYPPSLDQISKYTTAVSLGGEYSELHGFVGRILGDLKFGVGQLSIGSKFADQLMSVGMCVSAHYRTIQFSYGIEFASHLLGTPSLFQINFIIP